MYIQELDKNNKYELEQLKSFLNTLDLDYDIFCDYTISLLNDDYKIIATVSKEKNIIKCFGVAKEYQGEGYANKLLTIIHNKILDENYDYKMVFTKYDNKLIFESMGYTKVAFTDEVILLENGKENIEQFLDNVIIENKIDISKDSAMIVMNCNPFTNGHRYLIENASKEYKQVIVFVLEEDKSEFPFEIRIKLVKEGVKDLKNVIVIPSGRYIISSATFPSYFIKEKTKLLKEYIKLDSEIIISKFCKKLNIICRYLGSEELCSVTSKYNEYIKEIFPKNGIEVKIIPRKKINETIISASLVRKLINENKIEELRELVPKTTFDYIKKES
ncbi:[citrate (pro-3S)-lyase] ligase [Oceanivirga salmonicida]|uniref:[citrate (pro-3S)-lyase] ligase n=1 Tax=Oceanivirga salmonicida TaxID=1769291 RepID=UPI0008360B46|nr:[citrate (pro-3S)-lyase] ligase [Oceanivirga salmonicida]